MQSIDRRERWLTFALETDRGDRDIYLLDRQTQAATLLAQSANHGYAVLQVNYRGSTSYGRAYLTAGTREFGGKMHDDLIDGVRWAVERGVADPARVAIMGASYGGYAALSGLAFTPEMFAAGIDRVGIADMISLIENSPQYWNVGREFRAKVYGHV